MLFSLVLVLSVLILKSAWANPACAVCTIAVGASLELARRLGVDDSVVGVWAGAFLVLIGYWTIRWLDKKGWTFRGRDPLVLTLSVAMIGFMYVSKMTYHAEVIGILYLDPFLFSVLLGAAALICSSNFYQWMKARNGGHAHFPFEKVVIPVVVLFLFSLYFNYFPLCQHASGADLYSF
jgi:ABC-type antimicrobial peptide transport system permease subunit